MSSDGFGLTLTHPQLIETFASIIHTVKFDCYLNVSTIGMVSEDYNKEISLGTLVYLIFGISCKRLEHITTQINNQINIPMNTLMYTETFDLIKKIIQFPINLALKQEEYNRLKLLICPPIMEEYLVWDI